MEKAVLLFCFVFSSMVLPEFNMYDVDTLPLSQSIFIQTPFHDYQDPALLSFLSLFVPQRPQASTLLRPPSRTPFLTLLFVWSARAVITKYLGLGGLNHSN